MTFSGNIHLDILNASGRFLLLQDLIQTTVQRAVELVQTAMPVTDVDIVVQHDPQQTIEHLGFGGYTPDAHTIYLSVDTLRVDIGQMIETDLVHTLAHELHHTMRWRTVGYGDTLGEALVSEGLADHFDVEVTGGKPALWTQAVRDEMLNALCVRARHEFANTSYSHTDWFFGGTDSSGVVLPKWGGYALGYHLVGLYLAAHPQMHASKLYGILAQDVLHVENSH